MPHYIEDPDNPGQHIDLLRRNPMMAALPAAPHIVDALLKRDSWSRREAVAILAGYDPRIAREWLVECVPMPAGYLDGTTALTLQNAGLGAYSTPNWTDERRARSGGTDTLMAALGEVYRGEDTRRQGTFQPEPGVVTGTGTAGSQAGAGSVAVSKAAIASGDGGGWCGYPHGLPERARIDERQAGGVVCQHAELAGSANAGEAMGQINMQKCQLAPLLPHKTAPNNRGRISQIGLHGGYMEIKEKNTNSRTRLTL